MEKCPLCDTERVAGEDLCSNSKCGYEFSIPSQPKDSAEQTDDEWLEKQKQDTPIKPDDETLPDEEKKQESDNITCYYIEDGITSVQEKPSANGTKVNGKDITGQGKLELENDDVIELSGIVEVTFQSTAQTDEKKTKHTCPKCNKVSVEYHKPPTEEENELIEKSFGWRGNKIQSWCRLCRNSSTRKELEEKYAKDTNPNNLKEAIYEYRCGDCQHLEIDVLSMKLHQEQKGHYSDPTRIKKT